jgi:peptide chain release factor subunit 1
MCSRGFNKKSIQEAIRSIQGKLILYRAVPVNGLAIYCGNYTTVRGREKKLSLIFEPLLPLHHSLYQCDSQFHTKLLRDQFTESDVWGFIIIGGDGVSFHTLRGNTRATIYNWSNIFLPRKHNHGGQSKQRFERIREQKRGWYISEVAEMAVMKFIDKHTNLPNIKGLIIGGFADLKHELVAELDPRLEKIVICVIDVQYIGESGFRSAIEIVHSKLNGLKFVQEQKLIEKFFEAIATNRNYCYGYTDTMFSLEAGAIDTLIVWDKLECRRVTLKSKNSSDTKITYLLPDQQPKLDSLEEIVTEEPLLDWILDNYQSFGAKIELVSDNSSVGHQFAHSFGVAGFMRYKVTLPSEETDLEGETDPEEDADEEITW